MPTHSIKLALTPTPTPTPRAAEIKKVGHAQETTLRRVRVLMRMLCYGVRAVPCRAVRFLYYNTRHFNA